jgi:hypothetical protein
MLLAGSLRVVVALLIVLVILGCAGDGLLSRGGVDLDEDLPTLWEEEFSSEADVPLQVHDPSWRMIFGELQVSSSLGAVRADPASKEGIDDYAYRPQPATKIRIVQDWYWDNADGVGVENVVGINGSLYELDLWEDRLQLLRYDGGGDPSVYATLRVSSRLGLESGFYRLVFLCSYSDGRWTLSGEIQDPNSGYRKLGAVRQKTDSVHGPSIGQGVGIYNNSGKASYLLRMRVDGY